jgi:glycine betaine/proline transport system substrate-binding protein
MKAGPVHDFPKHFQWKPGEINTTMLATENGARPEATAQDWIAAHPGRDTGRVQAWLPVN